MKNSDVIKALLLAAVNEIAADPGKYAVNPGRDFTRNRKMGFHDTLMLLLTMEADCIKEELYRYFGRTTDAPSKAAFYKQRRKLTADALANLLYTFNSKLQKNLYNGKYQFIACDGSAVDIFRNPDDADTFFEPNGKSTRGFNQVHINAFYSILDRRFTSLLVQPGRKRNEYAAFCQMVDAAGSDGPPTIYFADMGYASYNNFAHVIENGQFLLIRCNDKRLGGILGRDVGGLKEMDCRVERILTRTRSKRKRSRPLLSERYRHICQAVPLDYLDETHGEYDISLRVVRFDMVVSFDASISYTYPNQEHVIGELVRIAKKRIIISVTSRLGSLPYLANPIQKNQFILDEHSDNPFVQWCISNRQNAIDTFYFKKSNIEKMMTDGLMGGENEIAEYEKGGAPWCITYTFMPNELEGLLRSFGVKNIEMAGPGAYARTIPHELLVKIMNDPKQRSDFLDICYKYDSNPYVCDMGKDNLLAKGGL